MYSVAVGRTNEFATPSIARRRRCDMTTNVSRRDFLKMTGIAGGGLVLAVYLEGRSPNKGTPTVIPVQVTPETSPVPRPPFDWNADIYIKLDQDGALTFTAFRSE